jgi:hydroxymethylbilane synthase
VALIKNKLKIATRKSPLALWQANFVKEKILLLNPQLSIELIEMTTAGDQTLDVSLSKVGGKGLFVKELEQALLTHEADIAVHSMKDMPVMMPPDLMIAACLKRHDPRDVLIAPNYQSLNDLPPGAVIGTSSLRRQSQILAYRQDLTIKPLRGNLGTRFNRLDAGDFDAIILAAAGVERLGLTDRIQEYISLEICLPAIGQGIIGVQCRQQDHALQALLKPLNDAQTELCLLAERKMNEYLHGGCQVPIAGLAQIESFERLHLQGRVFSPDGTVRLYASGTMPLAQADMLGQRVAEDLLNQGAKTIIDAVYNA